MEQCSQVVTVPQRSAGKASRVNRGSDGVETEPKEVKILPPTGPVTQPGVGAHHGRAVSHTDDERAQEMRVRCRDMTPVPDVSQRQSSQPQHSPPDCFPLQLRLQRLHQLKVTPDGAQTNQNNPAFWVLAPDIQLDLSR